MGRANLYISNFKTLLSATASVFVAYSVVIICFNFIDPIFFRSALGNNVITAGWGHSFQRYQDIEKIIESEQELDMIILGSSHAYRGFNTKLLLGSELEVHNLGSSSQSPLNSYYIAKEYLPRINPSVVVYEAYPNTFAIRSGLESYYDLSVNIENQTLSSKMALATKHPAAISNQFSLAIERSFSPLEEYTQSVNPTDKYVEGGYSRSDGNVTQEELECSPRDIELVDKQLDYFAKMLNFIKQEGIKIIVVIHPIPEETKLCFNNYDNASLRIKELTEAYGGSFRDYNYHMNLDSYQHFMDSNHLNAKGVDLFTSEFLVDYKAQNFD